MSDLNTENSWNFFMNKVKYCIDNYVPVKSNNKKFNKPKEWTNIVWEKLRKSITPKKRFTHSHCYRDYEEYCKLQNSASFQGGASFVDHLCYFCLGVLCFHASLFVDALWSPAGKGLTSWLSFVMSNCDLVTFPLVSCVRCGALLYRFLIFALFLTFKCCDIR